LRLPLFFIKKVEAKPSLPFHFF